MLHLWYIMVQRYTFYSVSSKLHCFLHIILFFFWLILRAYRMTSCLKCSCCCWIFGIFSRHCEEAFISLLAFKKFLFQLWVKLFSCLLQFVLCCDNLTGIYAVAAKILYPSMKRLMGAYSFVLQAYSILYVFSIYFFLGWVLSRTGSICLQIIFNQFYWFGIVFYLQSLRSMYSTFSEPLITWIWLSTTIYFVM